MSGRRLRAQGDFLGLNGPVRLVERTSILPAELPAIPINCLAGPEGPGPSTVEFWLSQGPVHGALPVARRRAERPLYGSCQNQAME